MSVRNDPRTFPVAFSRCDHDLLLYPQDTTFSCLAFLVLISPKRKQDGLSEKEPRLGPGGLSAAACGPLLRQPWRRRLLLLWPPCAQRSAQAGVRRPAARWGRGRAPPRPGGQALSLLKRRLQRVPHPVQRRVTCSTGTRGPVPSRHC